MKSSLKVPSNTSGFLPTKSVPEEDLKILAAGSSKKVQFNTDNLPDFSRVECNKWEKELDTFSSESIGE